MKMFFKLFSVLIMILWPIDLLLVFISNLGLVFEGNHQRVVSIITSRSYLLLFFSAPFAAYGLILAENWVKEKKKLRK